MLSRLEQKWNSIPEVLRWVLWLPLALAITGFAAVIGSIPTYFENGLFAEWIGVLFRTILCSIILLPLVYVLVPRAKKTFTSIVFVLIILACVLTVLRVGSLLYSEGFHLEHHDAIELMQALVWLSVGLATFRACMRGDLDTIK